MAHSLIRLQRGLQTRLPLRRRRSHPRIRRTIRLISVISSLVTLTAQRMVNLRPPLEAGRLPVVLRRTLKGMILATPTGADLKMACERYHWTTLMTALKKINKHGTLERDGGLT